MLVLVLLPLYIYAAYRDTGIATFCHVYLSIRIVSIAAVQYSPLKCFDIFKRYERVLMLLHGERDF